MPLPRTLHRTAEDGECALEIEEPTGPQRYGITRARPSPAGGEAQDPVCVLRAHAERGAGLLDRNVNAWLVKEEGERQLLRTLDGRVRAVLSERYRRLDNYDLAEHVLPTLQRLPEARFESVELTETRMYLKVVTPRVAFEVAPGRRRAGGSRREQLRGRVRDALSAAACFPAGVQERADRLRSHASQDARRARARLRGGFGRGLQGRHAACRRPGLLPEGTRCRGGGGFRSNASAGRRQAVPDDEHPARRRSGERRSRSWRTAMASTRTSARASCAT